MEFVYNDGGRSKYFRASGVGDCVTRAICNATGKDYKEVYNEIKHLVGYSPRDGIKNGDIKKYKIPEHFGGVWVPCMGFGTGCKVHMTESELPDGIIVVNVSHHLCCVIDGVIHDTYDPSRDGSRCVYGYWKFGKAKQAIHVTSFYTSTDLLTGLDFFLKKAGFAKGEQVEVTIKTRTI